VPILKSEAKAEKRRRISLRKTEAYKKLHVDTQGAILNVPANDMSESSSEYVKSDDEDEIMLEDEGSCPPSPEILIDCSLPSDP
jgi:hypothetical protein